MSPRPLPETFTARLVRGRPLTPRVRELVFERADQAPFTFVPGQWVSLVLPLDDEKGRPLRRSYSIASVPDGSPRFELIVTQVEGGRASSWLHRAAEGVSLEVKGPQGGFRLETLPAPSLFIATGTGIAPFRGMLHQALGRGGSEPLWVLSGARSEAEVLYREELAGLAQAHPRVRFEPSLSRPEAGWTGRAGYVQGHVAELWGELERAGASPAHAYVCGVRRMLEEVRVVLREQLGLERQRVHLERYD